MVALAISKKFSVMINLLMYYKEGQQAKVICLLQKLKLLSDVKAFPKLIKICRSKKKPKKTPHQRNSVNMILVYIKFCCFSKERDYPVYKVLNRVLVYVLSSSCQYIYIILNLFIMIHILIYLSIYLFQK